MFRKALLAVAAVLAVALLASRPAAAQNPDLTTLLTKFMVDLRAGTIGTNTTITKGTITRDGIALTSTDGLILENTTAATSGVTVQLSPRLRWHGTAWNSVGGASETQDWIAEVIPATVAGATTSQLRFQVSVNGGAFSTVMQLTTGGVIQVQADNALSWSTFTRMLSTADGLSNITVDAGTTGMQFNAGTAAATFDNGTITVGSRNMAGQVTLTGGNVGGTVSFGTPAWTNTPFCTVSGSAATDTPNITAASANAFTVAGITANGVFTYNCIGRI